MYKQFIGLSNFEIPNFYLQGGIGIYGNVRVKTDGHDIGWEFKVGIKDKNCQVFTEKSVFWECIMPLLFVLHNL